MAATDECIVLGPLSLETPSLSDRDKVCQSLLDWPDCTRCGKLGHCTSSICPWSKKAEIQPYLRFYEEVACGSRPADPFEVRQTLQTHDELLSIIRLIKSRPRCARRTIMQEHFATYDQPPSLDEQTRAFDIAIRLLTMVECSMEGLQWIDSDAGPLSVVWKAEDSAITFAQSAVHSGVPLTYEEIMLLLPDLTAQNLKAHKLILVWINDIRDHLLYNPKARTVHIFHYAGFLRECLYRENPIDMSIFPRRLAFETLHSLQSVLFPLHDLASRAIVGREGLDRACLGVDTSCYNVQFEYWGERMRILARVLEKGKPASGIWAWLKRRSRIEIVMLLITAFAAMVTLATLVLDAWKRRDKDD